MENEGNQSNTTATNSSVAHSAGPVRKNKHKKKKKNKNKKKNQNLGVKKTNFKGNRRNNMTSFAESLSNAATWQFKHQIAYWKAKAKALEFENSVLHDIIRKSQLGGSSSNSTADMSVEESAESDSESSSSEIEFINGVKESADPDLEVSEAFIEFLSANAKYKEDARLERERYRAQQNVESEGDKIKRMEAPPCKDPVDKTKELQELYGGDWRKISALETAAQCQFMLESDKCKPTFWPNIPFNFNYS
ncbi:unnamed protein product [Plutella xylostella]|uniref:(diamondback moth) hypothetical protein n=1 Tax=Plutella xylostella TaxID=51655 RepID=A0A8S4FR71_PLUXY|nr:unnamed protein product [Plutella xylostella]